MSSQRRVRLLSSLKPICAGLATGVLFSASSALSLGLTGRLLVKLLVFLIGANVALSRDVRAFGEAEDVLNIPTQVVAGRVSMFFAGFAAGNGAALATAGRFHTEAFRLSVGLATACLILGVLWIMRRD